jgi:hypothetical protein
MAFGGEMSDGGTGATQVAVRVLAKSLFKELKRAGYNRSEMVAFASELLDLVTTEIKKGGESGPKSS